MHEDFRHSLPRMYDFPIVVRPDCQGLFVGQTIFGKQALASSQKCSSTSWIAVKFIEQLLQPVESHRS